MPWQGVKKYLKKINPPKLDNEIKVTFVVEFIAKNGSKQIKLTDFVTLAKLNQIVNISFCYSQVIAMVKLF
jgi:hypothetical protein